jgi:chromosome segregation ATPase
LQKAKAALEGAERAVKLQKEALTTAQREAAERHLRTETLRARLSRVETSERDALQLVAQVKAAMACRERLAVAEKSLAELEADKRDLETKLTANAAAKQECDARQKASVPLPIQAALLVGLLGGAIAAALGIGLQVPSGVLAGAIVGSTLFAAGVAAFILRHRKLRGAIQLLRLETDDLAKAREKLLERRNQVLTERGVAQMRVEAARSGRDQAMVMLRDLDVAPDKAGSRLQEVRRELEGIRRELATLEGHQPKHDGFSSADVEAADRAVVRLKEQVLAKTRLLDEARHRCAEARLRCEAANSSAASIDLAGLEQRVNTARMKADGQVAPDPAEAQMRLQRAKQTAAELETTMRVAKGRLSDARSSFEGIADALGQPADQVLAEAEKERKAAEQALEGLEESSSAEEAAAEREFLEAQAAVARLDEGQTMARTKAEAATKARDQARTKREQARATLEALLSSFPNAKLTDAEAALAQARSELESDSGGLITLPESLAAVEALLKQQQAELRRTENELQQARGQLKFVGGTVARDQRDQESQSLDDLKKSAEDLELEYWATKRLLDVLNEEEVKQAAHLGRSLAKPVTDIFAEFTSGRYAQVVLDPGLRFKGVMAKGSERDLASLSVGTRDQLATLVRLALAAHLKSVIVLDDQLAQSDPQRLVWFRDRLRASVGDHNHQIIVITCRPLDYLQPQEMPVPPCDRFETEDGKLAVVDLERVTSSRQTGTA